MQTLVLPTPITPEEAVLRLHGLPGLAWVDAGTPGKGWSFVGVEPSADVGARFGNTEPLACMDLIEGSAHESDVDEGDSLRSGDVPRWIGVVTYDAGAPRRLDRASQTSSRIVSFRRYDALLAYDHTHERACVVGDDRAACEHLVGRLAAAAPERPRARVRGVEADDPALHLAAIEAALEHIRRGDVYQVNLARRWRARLEGAPLALYLAMRRASPVPLGLYYDDGEQVVLSRTMERFLAWRRRDGALETRPIKGTVARRGGRDDAERAALAADPKERAEHVMIVDLMRNDLGRVARTGSVEVAELLRTEPYAGLHHLVSTVRCTTRPGTTLRDVLEATFPPGSVTGTPKLRALDIIAALEAHPRGVYTGAVGFVDRAGGLSLAVAIRTAVAARGCVDYWAGGGIVEASRPERELAETELKARVFLDAAAALEAEPGAALSPAAPVR